MINTHSETRLQTGIGALGVALFVFLLGSASWFLARQELLVLGIGAATFALVVLFCYLRPQLGMVFVVFFSILFSLDIAITIEPLPRIGPTRGFMGAFVIAAILRILFHGRLADEARAQFPLIKLITLYVLSNFISTVVSVAPLTSFYAVVGREIIEQFFLFFLLTYFLQAPGFWGRLKTGIYAATLVVCLYAFVEEAIGMNPLLVFYPDAWPDVRAGILRVRSTFFHPIALGCYINLIFPLVVTDLLRPSTTPRRMFFVMLAFFLLITSFLTVSRVPWICLFLEILVFVVWFVRHDLRRVTMLLSVVVLGMLAVVLAYNLNATVNNLFSPFVAPTRVEEGSTSYYRWVVVEAVWDRVQSPRMIFGYGPNSFNEAEVEVTYDNVTRILYEPDLHYARIVFELGIVGSTLFLLLLGLTLHKGYCALRDLEGEAQFLALACTAGIAGFILVNFSVSMYTMYPLGMLYWLLVAVLYRLPLQEEEQHSPEAQAP
ncbi:MAG: O-antigen ligase family protein [Candidatus Hydrogenedentes bacterium]|nr:O-antigen ligase family protein [Candidatus Hydrogenedentota bacterium]